MSVIDVRSRAHVEHDVQRFRLGDHAAPTDALGRVLVHLVEHRSDVAVLDADGALPVSAAPIIDAHPERCIRFGHRGATMLTVAAAMTGAGISTVLVAPSTTLLVHGQPGLREALDGGSPPLVLCGIDVSGSHPGADPAVADLAFARATGSLEVIVPADANAALRLVPRAIDAAVPTYLRIEAESRTVIHRGDEDFGGRSLLVREGRHVTIVATGVMVARSLAAAEELERIGVSCEVIDAFSVVPLDEDTIVRSALRTGAVVTAEAHRGVGGLGGAVAELLATTAPTPMELLVASARSGPVSSTGAGAAYGIDTAAVVRAVRRLLGRTAR